MSLARAWYVRCDRCGNPAEISTEDGRNARMLARLDGFVRRRVDGRTTDLCKACATTGRYPR